MQHPCGATHAFSAHAPNDQRRQFRERTAAASALNRSMGPSDCVFMAKDIGCVNDHLQADPRSQVLKKTAKIPLSRRNRVVQWLGGLENRA